MSNLSNFDAFDYNLTINPNRVYVDKNGNVFYEDVEVDNIYNLQNITSLRQDLLRKDSELHRFLLKFYKTEEISSWIFKVKEKSIPAMAVGLIGTYLTLKGNIFAISLITSIVVKDFTVRGRELKSWGKKEQVILLLTDQISEDAKEWNKTFDPLFWQALKHVYGYIQGQNGCAQTIAADIYRWFPDVICNKLNEVCPLNEYGYRPRRLHQHFKEEMEHYLKLRISTVTSVYFSCEKLNRKECKKKLQELPAFLANVKFLKN